MAGKNRRCSHDQEPDEAFHKAIARAASMNRRHGIKQINQFTRPASTAT
jgi:putative ribosome biogenesis GTPase RsgA